MTGAIVKTNNVTLYQNQPLNLAEAVGPKLEELTDKFSLAMNLAGLERFDYQPGCTCQVCQLEGQISSIFGILEIAARANDYETAVAS